MAEDEDKKKKDKDVELTAEQIKQYKKLKEAYDDLSASIDNLGMSQVERDNELERIFVTVNVSPFPLSE